MDVFRNGKRYACIRHAGRAPPQLECDTFHPSLSMLDLFMCIHRLGCPKTGFTPQDNTGQPSKKEPQQNARHVDGVWKQPHRGHNP